MEKQFNRRVLLIYLFLWIACVCVCAVHESGYFFMEGEDLEEMLSKAGEEVPHEDDHDHGDLGFRRADAVDDQLKYGLGENGSWKDPDFASRQFWVNFSRDCGHGFVEHTGRWIEATDVQNLKYLEKQCNSSVEVGGTQNKLPVNANLTVTMAFTVYPYHVFTNRYQLDLFNFQWVYQRENCYLHQGKNKCGSYWSERNNSEYRNEPRMNEWRPYDRPALFAHNKTSFWMFSINRTELRRACGAECWFLKNYFTDRCPAGCSIMLLHKEHPGRPPAPPAAPDAAVALAAGAIALAALPLLFLY